MKFLVDLRSKMSLVGDQGDRPTCVAFALTACHESVFPQSSKEFSKDSLHWGCVSRDGSAINGVRVNTALIVLKEEGQHLESDWPYRSDLNEVVWESLQPPNLDGKPMFNIKETFVVKIDNPQVLFDVLMSKGPVFTVIPIWESFFEPRNGILSLPKVGAEEFRGHHAVCLVGITTEYGVLIRNSWGKNWGDFGHAILPFKYLTNYVCITCTLIPLEEK